MPGYPKAQLATVNDQFERIRGAVKSLISRHGLTPAEIMQRLPAEVERAVEEDRTLAERIKASRQRNNTV